MTTIIENNENSNSENSLEINGEKKKKNYNGYLRKSNRNKNIDEKETEISSSNLSSVNNINHVNSDIGLEIENTSKPLSKIKRTPKKTSLPKSQSDLQLKEKIKEELQTQNVSNTNLTDNNLSLSSNISKIDISSKIVEADLNKNLINNEKTLQIETKQVEAKTHDNPNKNFNQKTKNFSKNNKNQKSKPNPNSLNQKFSNHSNSKYPHKKHTPHFKRSNQLDDAYILEEENSTPSILFTKENMLISYMRQKSGFNPIFFWKELGSLLEEKNFEDIKNNNMSILSYAVLYGKEDIYNDLLNRFGSHVAKEEFETVIFNFCLNRNVSFLKDSLSFYEKQFDISDDFIHITIEEACKSSYRENNNYELLNWLNPKLSEQQIAFFWEKCILERNVVLLEQALHYENLHRYLRENYDVYKNTIEQLHKHYTVEQSFIKPNYDISSLYIYKENHSFPLYNDINVESLGSSFLSVNKPEKRMNTKIQTNTNTRELSPLIKNDIKQTEVVIKKKRKLI